MGADSEPSNPKPTLTFFERTLNKIIKMQFLPLHSKIKYSYLRTLAWRICLSFMMGEIA